MRYSKTVISILALLTISPAFAANASKEETIGVSAGSIIGAIAGGPVGFVVGAAIGAKLGDKIHRKNDVIDTLFWVAGGFAQPCGRSQAQPADFEQ